MNKINFYNTELEYNEKVFIPTLLVEKNIDILDKETFYKKNRINY